MLTLEEVKPTCIYWANKFKSRQFEFNELYAEAYLIAIKQTTVFTLQKSVKGCLLRFMIKRNRLTSICQPFQDDAILIEGADQMTLSKIDHTNEDIVDMEELLKVLDEANIDNSSEFLELLHLRFVEGLSQKEIATRFNVSQQIISQRCKAVLDSIKTVNRRRMSHA